MDRHRIARAALLCLLAASWLAASVTPDTAERYRKQFEGRQAYLRVNIFADVFEVTITSEGIRRPSGVALNARFSAGEPVRIQAVRFDDATIAFAFSVPDGSRSGTVRFLFEKPLDEVFGEEAHFASGVEAVFNFRARLGTTAPRDPEPEAPENPEPEPEEDAPEEPDPDKPDLRQEVRLLVEPGSDVLPGDGDTVTTLTISARDADGRLLENVSGPVDVRINAGRLSADRTQMTGGLARVNFQVPILDDENKVLQRSIQLTYVIVQKLLGKAPGADPREIVLEAAKRGPNAASLSTVKGDKPFVLIVAELQGVKGKGKITLTPAGTAAGLISPGLYEGKDVTGSTTWTFDTQSMILKQQGYPDEIKVEYTGQSYMGFYQITLGGMISSVVPLPGDSFYLFAPPVLFNRVSAGAELPSAPEEVKPKPTVTLTARKNPLAADGESTTELVFQYLDETGKPKAGLPLEWKLDRYGVFAESQKGRLLATEPVTRADGTARAVYQAPRLDAKDMQETGAIKNRDVLVAYPDGEKSGQVSCQVGLLKSAPVMLVVEKPGVERAVLPLQIGSLNGTIKGRILLRVVQFRLPGTATRLPLQNASVKLEGDEKILKWAAVDKTVTDEDGQFTLEMHMKNWPRWDKELKQPFLVAPSARFVNLQHNALQHIEKWPASAEVGSLSKSFVLGAQARLAELEAEDAEGLLAKMELLGWMLLVLKDTRKDAIETGQEFMGHAWSMLTGVASYFYADSKLDKYIKEKYKLLEKTVGIRQLKALKARWEKSQSAPSSVSGRIYRYLLKWFYRTPPNLSRSDDREMRRFTRSTLNELLLPQIIKAISDFMGQYVPEMPVPDVKGMITGALLKPYDDLGNQYLLLFLQNDDYDQIRSGHVSAYARLKVRHAGLAREYQQVTAWRIAENYVQTLVDTVSECGQVALKIIGTIYLQPEIVKHAETLEKIQKALDNVMAGVRFIEECYRFVEILDKSLNLVLACTADLSGVPVQTAAWPPAGDGQRLVLAVQVPGEPPAETPRLELEDNMDWNAFEAPGGQVSTEALAYLTAADEAMAAWQMETAPGLLALRQGDEARMKKYLEGIERWESLQRQCRLLALHGLERPLQGIDRQQWEQLAARFRQQTTTCQEMLDDTCAAIDALPLATEVVIRQTMQGKSRGSLLPDIPFWAWAVLGGAAIMCGMVVLAAVAWRRKSRRPVAPASVSSPDTPPRPAPAGPPRAAVTGPSAPTVANPEAPWSQPRMSVPKPAPAPPAPAGHRLRDAQGRIIALVEDCITLGSAPDNTVVISVQGVSRRHARIWRTPAHTFWIEDLGSTNGLYANGQRVAKAWLEPGTLIALGQWQARFE